MSENLNRGIRDFSKYDTMETAELEEILRLDAEAPEGAESDTDLLYYVMGVLADRRRNSDNPGKTAFEAWESFEKHYMPREEETAAQPEENKCIRFAPWLRRAAAAAAVVVLLLCLPLTAKAFDLGDLWDVFACWAKETFSFVSGEDTPITEPVPVNQEEYASLQDALEKSNRDPSIVPTWIPEGYDFENVIKDVSPTRESYVALYVNNDSILKISIQSYLIDDPAKIEVNDSLVEIYPSLGVDYYIFSNMNQMKVIWITDSYECSIAGDAPIDALKMMIDSIGKE